MHACDALAWLNTLQPAYLGAAVRTMHVVGWGLQLPSWSSPLRTVVLVNDASIALDLLNNAGIYVE